MMTDVRFSFRQCRTKTGQEDDSFAGQQNPTCGTGPFLGGIRAKENLHGISALRRTAALGMAVAKGLRVVESTSRPHCIQIPLSNL
jgi:hypothetical protein